jgi:hypothetical protein
MQVARRVRRHPASRSTELSHTEKSMAGLFKGILAGWGASKLGGGCITTVIVFILLFWLLSAVF